MLLLKELWTRFVEVLQIREIEKMWRSAMDRERKQVSRKSKCGAQRENYRD